MEIINFPVNSEAQTVKPQRAWGIVMTGDMQPVFYPGRAINCPQVFIETVYPTGFQEKQGWVW